MSTVTSAQGYDGIFVGGSLRWKLATGGASIVRPAMDDSIPETSPSPPAMAVFQARPKALIEMIADVFPETVPPEINVELTDWRGAGAN